MNRCLYLKGSRALMDCWVWAPWLTGKSGWILQTRIHHNLQTSKQAPFSGATSGCVAVCERVFGSFFNPACLKIVLQLIALTLIRLDCRVSGCSSSSLFVSSIFVGDLRKVVANSKAIWIALSANGIFFFHPSSIITTMCMGRPLPWGSLEPGIAYNKVFLNLSSILSRVALLVVMGSD